jgi:hypothetical protein
LFVTGDIVPGVAEEAFLREQEAASKSPNYFGLYPLGLSMKIPPGSLSLPPANILSLDYGPSPILPF